MTSKLLPGSEELLQSINYTPCVSIIIPFEPKMSLKAELDYKLKLAIGKVESRLMAEYTEDKVSSVLHKLNVVVKKLDYNTYKKSIAIFISPTVEKVLYLDVAVEEKIIVDTSFEIRDLVYNKKEMQKFLVLVISAKKSRIFLGSISSFIRIVSNIPDYVTSYNFDKSGRGSNFSDPSEMKEIVLEKFLRHTDSGLSILLKAYPLPLFVMGTEKIIGNFNTVSHNTKRIAGIVKGNFDDANEEELRNALEPSIADWKKVKQQDILYKLENAAGERRLALGMHDVWKGAMHKKGKLLVVEKNFIYPARFSENKEDIYAVEDLEIQEAFIKDAVDDVIEKVFENGGDVEFVDAGILNYYNKIALILYY